MVTRYLYLKRLWIGKTAREVHQLVNYLSNKLNLGNGVKLSVVRAHIRRGILTITYKDLMGVNRFKDDDIKQYIKFLYPQLLITKVETKVALKYFWFSDLC